MQEKHSLVCRADLVIDFDNKSTLVFEFKFRKTGSAKTAEDLLNEALQQIKEKQYPASIEAYTGKILLVALSYDKKTKHHKCIIEKYTK